MSPSSPVITIDSPNSASATFEAPQVDSDTTFTFRLTVSDGTHPPATDTVAIIVTDGDTSTVDPPVQDPDGSRTYIWSVDRLVGALGSEPRYEFRIFSECDEGTSLSGATLTKTLMGLGGIGLNPAGGGFPGTVTIDVDGSQLRPGYWSLALIMHYPFVDTISETPYARDGIILNEYMAAQPGDVFEYPDGASYTKAQLGAWTAYAASVQWEGPGSCTLGMGPAEWWK